MIPIRSSAELFAEAARGTLAADGYRFAIANQIEAMLLQHVQHGQGYARVGDLREDPAIAAGRVIALTGGAVAMVGHVEELFTVALFAISPRGGQAAFQFRHGASGLVLTGGPAGEHAALGRAWTKALATVTPVTFSIRADSDFGRVELGAKGTPPHKPPWDPTWIDQAEAAARVAEHDEGAARALRDLYAVQITSWRFADQKLDEGRYMAAAAPLWPPALAWLEAAVAAVPADAYEIPALVEHLGAIVPYPQTRALDRLGIDPGAWFARMDALVARRAAAHPW